MKRQIITILAAAIMVAPAASATWRAFGSFEPDHPRDVSDGFMFLDRDATRDGKRVYFNVVQQLTPTGVNTNSGLLGSRLVVPGPVQQIAIFGPWKDCNDDGYVGLAESAVVTYSSTLLSDTSICPPGLTIHNDGQWVYEWIPVGHDYQEEQQNFHQMQIDDNESLVWGDNGLPGQSFRTACPLTPFPHGTHSGTGHTIRFFDCLLGFRIQGTSDQVTSVADPSDSLGLRWDNYEEPQLSDSQLNQHYPVNFWGNPTNHQTGLLELDSNEDNPAGQNGVDDRDYAFTTWDRDAQGNCNGRAAEVSDPVGLPTLGEDGVATVGPDGYVIWDPTYDGEDGLVSGNYGKEDENFTDSDGRWASVANPDPRLRHEPEVDSDLDDGDGAQVHTGSYADGLNETVTGVRVGGGDDAWDNNVGGDCNREDDGLADGSGESTYNDAHSTAFFRFDAPFEPASSIKKVPDHPFAYFNGGEQEGVTAQIFGENAPNSLVSVAPLWYANDPQWYTQITTITTPQSIDRNTAQAHPARVTTWYAKVGKATFSKDYVSKLGGADKFKVYGAEACTSGIGEDKLVPQNNWWCKPSYWYTDGSFNPIQDGSEVWIARVGYQYQFRDVDCYDGTLVDGVGARASLVDLNGGPCPEQHPDDAAAARVMDIVDST